MMKTSLYNSPDNKNFKTNREWLESLSDDDFTKWLLGGWYEVTIEGITTTVYSGLPRLVHKFSDDTNNVKQWLSAIHKENSIKSGDTSDTSTENS